MKIHRLIKKAVLYAATLMAAGMLLSACSTTATNGGCVGPPDFCRPYFGS